MQRNNRYYILLFGAMIGAHLLSSTLISSLFIGATPHPAWSVFNAKLAIIQEQFISSTGNLQQSVIKQFMSTERKVMTEPSPTVALISSQQTGFFDTLPAPTAPLAPTSTPFPTQPILPTLIPTHVITPTLRPTNNPFPTSIYTSPVPTQKPKPTIIAKPTKPPPTNMPSAPVDGSLIVQNPLNQPYYQSSAAYKCSTPDRMIELYGNKAAQTNCYSAVQSAVKAQIVSTSILGKGIQVHKRVLPAFVAVAKELDAYPHSNGTYTFPSKKYTVRNAGAYIFRCNVNASTSGKFDLCASGCVLSMHSFGIAVDINYESNCNGCETYDMPKEIVDAFEKYGFRWGGRYKSIFGSTIDPMHFEYLKEACTGL